MRTFHISVSIDYLLKRQNKWLAKFFPESKASGKEIRESLREQKKAGDELIVSKGCKKFDTKTGCECNKDYKPKKSKK